MRRPRRMTRVERVVREMTRARSMTRVMVGVPLSY